MTEYYSLEEVMKKLNKSKSTILREAKVGLIPSEIEEGKKKGRLYPKVAIDALAEIEHEKRAHNKIPHLVFSPSTPNDLWAEVNIGRELYGEDDIVPYKTLLQWREINDEIFMSLKEDGRVVAYSSLMPLDEMALQALVEDKFRERDIPLSAIKQWTDPQISVYVSTVTVKQSNDREKNKERGMEILRNTLRWALALNRQSDIKNWYGIGATKEGQRLFERLGFTETISMYQGERKGYYLNNITTSAGLISLFFREGEQDKIPIR